MTKLYNKSRQLRVHLAIIESQVKLGRNKTICFNKNKPNSRIKLSPKPEKL